MSDSDPVQTSARRAPSAARPDPDAAVVTCDAESLAHRRPLAAPSDPDLGYPVPDWEHYDFLATLGRGGMGVVYEAKDRRLGRRVALKFIRGGDPHLALRFMQEARAQARIAHDNVCKVYEVGQVQGRSYIAMELLSGQTLEQAHGALHLPDKIEIIRQVARGLHEAHRLGIIHRDVKPANVMAERLADGRPHAVVMDFGLARQADEGQGLTESGALLGTPAFMSPEQARGDVRNLDRRSDVYSLGATFYFLLSGERPFVGATTVEVLLAVISQEALPLRRAIPSLPADLETIVMKCLEKDPTRRYDSALELADDLDRYVAGEPIQGRRAGILYRLQRQARKHRVLVFVGAVAVLGIGTSSALNLRTQWRTAAQLRLTQQLGEAAKEAEVVMQRAHLMPLHDTRREQRLAVKQLQRINEQMRTHAPLADGPGHYALGRGYLAIGDYERAESELTKARASGYDSPALSYAQGRVLIEFYRRGVTAAEFIASDAAKAERTRELDRIYLQPAQRHLARFAGESDQPSSRFYAEALLAFYGKDDERALHKAEEAFAQEPWVYETLKLRSDILLRRGLGEIEQGRFAAGLTQLTRAQEALSTTAELGRSDPAVYAAQAAVWLQILGVEALGLGRSPERAFAGLLKACEQALQADPDDSDVLRVKLLGYNWLLRYKELHSSLEPELQTALALYAQAQRQRPQDSVVYQGAGDLFLLIAHHEFSHGKNPLPSYQKAIDYLQQASALHAAGPFKTSLRDIKSSLGTVYRQMGTYALRHGDDPQPYYIKALAQFDDHGQTVSDLSEAYRYRTFLYTEWSEYVAKTGGDPRPLLERGIKEQGEAIKQIPSLGGSYGGLADTYLVRFDYELQQGIDPEPSLRLAESTYRQTMATQSEVYLEESVHGRILLHRAMLDAARGVDPTPQLVQARRAFETARAHYPTDAAIYRDECRVELVAARWAVQRAEPKAAAHHFTAAAAAIDEALRIASGTGKLLRQAAVLYRDQGAALPRESRLPVLQRGIAMTDKALAIDAKDGEARALRGALLLLQAQAATTPAACESATQAAVRELAEALQINGNLRREYQPLLAQARAGCTPRAAAQSIR